MTFLTYARTLQAEALALVAAKMRASLMVEGELPEEGLAALDGGDLYLALARRLAGGEAGIGGQEQSLEALFAEARRSEDQADEFLVDDHWAVEPEPSPFPVPAGVGPLAELPLLASRGAPPAAAATGGELVTLEEVARVVRRRTSRRRPVPEGQLALFGL